jgi:hypothetical protein
MRRLVPRLIMPCEWPETLHFQRQKGDILPLSFRRPGLTRLVRLQLPASNSG